MSWQLWRFIAITRCLAIYLPVSHVKQLKLIMFFGNLQRVTVENEGRGAEVRGGSLPGGQGDKEIDFPGLFVVVLPVLTLWLD